jgi:hypothetical protein
MLYLCQINLEIMAIDLEKLKEYLASEEGQASMNRMAEKWAKEDDFNKRWKKKFKNFLKEQTDESLEVLFDKFHKHAEKRRDILWKQRYDGETSLYTPLYSAIAKLGKKAKKKKYNMFTSGMYEWRGYQVEYYCGQGSFHSLSKI